MENYSTRSASLQIYNGLGFLAMRNQIDVDLIYQYSRAHGPKTNPDASAEMQSVICARACNCTLIQNPLINCTLNMLPWRDDIN